MSNMIWKTYYGTFIYIGAKITNRTQDALAIHYALA